MHIWVTKFRMLRQEIRRYILQAKRNIVVRTDTKHYNQRVQRCVVVGASGTRTEGPGNTVSTSLVVHSLKRRQTTQNALHSSLSSQKSQYSTFNTADCHWLLNTIFMLTNHKYLFKGRHKLDIIKKTRGRGIFTCLALRFEAFAKN